MIKKRGCQRCRMVRTVQNNAFYRHSESWCARTRLSPSVDVDVDSDCFLRLFRIPLPLSSSPFFSFFLPIIVNIELASACKSRNGKPPPMERTLGGGGGCVQSRHSLTPSVLSMASAPLPSTCLARIACNHDPRSTLWTSFFSDPSLRIRKGSSLFFSFLSSFFLIRGTT